MYTFNDVRFLTEISNKDICNLKGVNTDELMLKALQRAWVRCWLGIKRTNSIFSKSHYDNKDLFTTDTLVVRSFVPSSKIAKFSSMEDAEDNFNEVEVDKASLNRAMKARAKSDEGIRIILKFKYERNFFVVSIMSITSSDEEIFHAEDYRKAMLEEISKVNERLENTEIFTKKRFLNYFFETMHAANLSIATGTDAECFWTIYFNAKEHFPEFAALDLKDQFRILQRAFFYCSKAKTKDIHTYAKEVIHVLYDKNLISKFVYKHKEYTLLKKNYRDITSPGGKTRRVLNSLDYKSNFRTSFRPFDLWNSLTRSANSDDDDE